VIDPDWAGFHIALKAIPFLSCWDWGLPRQGPNAAGPKKLIIWTAAQIASGDPFGSLRYGTLPSRSAKKLLPRYSKTGEGNSANPVSANLLVADCDNRL
jgi:hypothetical protein